MPGAAVVAFPAGIDRAVAPSEATPDGPVRRTQSGADGRFTLAVEPAAPVLGVFAEAPGLSPALVQNVRPSEDVTIRLDPARTITGFVRDLGARPVPGAKVTWLGLFDRARIERTGVSAADGAYRIEGMPSNSVLRNYSYIYEPWIEVTADGFARLLVRFDDARRRSLEPSPAMDFYLTRGAELRGRVRDAETGAPIAGAPLSLWITSANVGHGGPLGSFDSPWGDREIARTVSDEQGRYAIPRIPAETIPSPALGQSDERGYAFGNIAAMPAGYVGAVGYVTLGGEGDVIDVDVACWPAAAVEGRVVDAEGRPVAGATVGCLTTDVERRGGWFPPKYREVLRGGATTDSAGRYRISGCAALRGQASPAKVDAFDPNYGKLAEGWNEPHPSASVTVRAGETTKAPDLVMTPFPTLTIAVKDDRRRPVAGATVRWPYSGTTGGDGTCRFAFGSTDVKRARGKPAEVLVDARGFAKTFALMPLPPPDSRFEVTLREAREVRGRVIDSNGSPAVKVTVRAVNPAASAAAREAQRTTFEGRETADEGLVLYGSTHTWDTNTFTIGGLPDGPYELIAIRHRQPVWGARRSEVSAVVTNVPTGATDVVIQLPPEEEAAQVEQTTPLDGSVVDAKTGEMLVRFEAMLAKPGQGVASTKLAPGRFRFDAVPAGTWNLSVKAPGYAAWEARDLMFPGGPGGVAPVKAEMRRGITVQGRVIVPADVDLSNLEIAFCKSGCVALKRCVAQKDGSYRLTDLPAGEYRVTTHWRSGRSTYTYLARDVEPIVLRDEEPVATRDLRFSPGGLLLLRIKSPRLPKDAYDESATEDQVRVLQASRAEIRDSKDAMVWSGLAIDSGVDWLGVAPGDYRVRVTLPGAEPQEKTVMVKAGEGTRVAFEFP